MIKRSKAFRETTNRMQKMDEKEKNEAKEKFCYFTQSVVGLTQNIYKKCICDESMNSFDRIDCKIMYQNFEVGDF